MPDLVVLRPNRATLWFNYLMGLPLLALFCAVSVLSVFSDHNTGKPFFAVLSVVMFIWFVPVFRFDVPERTLSIDYPFGRHAVHSATDIEDCRAEMGTRTNIYYDGPQDRVLHLRSGRLLRLKDLHETPLMPEGFDRIMQAWNVPMQAGPVPADADPVRHYKVNANGMGVYRYPTRWEWIITCLVVAFGCCILILGPGSFADADFINTWFGAFFVLVMLLGAYAVAMPVFRFPIGAALGPLDLELRYLLRPGKRLEWSRFSGFAKGLVLVGGRKYQTEQPIIILYDKAGGTYVLPSLTIRSIEHAPFANFGLPQFEAPRPFQIWNKVPDRPKG